MLYLRPASVGWLVMDLSIGASNLRNKSCYDLTHFSTWKNHVAWKKHVEKILKNLLGSKEVGDGVSGEVDLSDSVPHVGEFVIDDVINEFSDVDDERVVTGDRGLLVFVVVEHLKMWMLDSKNKRKCEGARGKKCASLEKITRKLECER